MRIIGGCLKGRKLSLPKKMRARPTTDFAREGLFNWLHHQDYIEGKVCADFFCGSGAMGLEMISRGAKTVYALDIDPVAVRHLKQVKEEWQLPELHIIRGAFHQVARVFEQPLDLIFADPPYNYSRYDEIPELVYDRAMLNPGGILVVEHDRHRSFAGKKGFLTEKRYGNVHFSFFEFT